MANFYVLTPPVPKNPEKDTLFIRDGFSWLAFFFPLPWLLLKKMWWIAGLAVIFYLVAVIIAEQWGLDGMPVAFSFILSLWTSLEGGHVRAKLLERSGWNLNAVIAAHDLNEAEEIYFAGPAGSSAPGSMDTMPIDRHRQVHGTMALGLIGSYGDR
jgi:hypothetical protein